MGIVIYYCRVNDLIIFPDKGNYTFFFYNDEPNGGNSNILNQSVSDSLLIMKYQLGDKFQSPYVGLSITPVDETAIDARRFNELTLTIKGQNTDRIGISLYTTPTGFHKKQTLEETLFHSFLNISNELKTYSINIKHLKHPDWWEDYNQLPENDKGTLDLSKILHINIGSAYSSNTEKDKTLEITYIAFTRDNTKLFVIAGLIYLGFLILIFTIVYFYLSGKNRNSKIVVEYKPVDKITEVPKEEECIKYINSNYSISDLTLEKISEETGISQRNITKVIKERYDCNFKTYLNRIRINESKRFLIQSDLNIGEIAFKIGFNSQSHFNRVFKNEIQVSPSEYREAHKY